jgi:hypothetical protein
LRLLKQVFSPVYGVQFCQTLEGLSAIQRAKTQQNLVLRSPAVQNGRLLSNLEVSKDTFEPE